MSIKCAVLGTTGSWRNHSFKANHVVHDLAEVLPEPVRFESRAGFPNHGNGPYFRCVARPHWEERSGSKVDLGSDDWDFEYTNYQGFRTFHLHQEWLEEGRVHYLERIQTLNGIRETSSSSTYMVYTYYDPPEDPKKYIAKATVYRYTWDGSKWVQSVTTNNISGNRDLEYINVVPPMGELYDEFLTAAEIGLFNTRMRQALAGAYLEAFRSLPEANVNLLGNLKEAFDYVKGAISAIKNPKSALAGLFETASDPKQLWLTYRYVYNTTKADVEELTDLVSRFDYLSNITKSKLKAMGSVKLEDIRYGVSIRLPLSSVLPSDLMDALHQFGLNVTPSNIWDLVPYSFMVDWFLGIGDKLSFFEDWIGAAELKPDEVWFTARAQNEDASYYYRVRGYIPSVPPIYVSSETSGKTVMMRVADTVSIFT